jgi:hypothetical protein
MEFGQSVFKLENTDGILDFTFSDSTPVWPILRWQLRNAEMQNHAQGGRPRRSEVPVSLWRYILFCLQNRPILSEKPDVLSIANDEGNPEVPNRMTRFLKDIPELKTQEWLYSARRRMFTSLIDTYSFDYFFYISWLKSKLMFTSPNQRWEKQVDEFLNPVRQKLVAHIRPEAWNQIRSELSFINRVVPFYRKTLKTALKKAKPKFVLVSEGNNGEWKQAVLFQVAKELQIPTGEVQHGVFNLGMKYADKLALNPKLKSMKSDFQFVFGPFHASLTNAPVQCIPFGHYDLERAAVSGSSAFDVKTDDCMRILLVGEGIPPSSIDNGLLKHTYEALKGFQKPFELVIRLHPSETPDEKYEPFFEFPGTRYSEYTTETVHSLLKQSDVVISHASTVVFEALYYNLPVLVLQDANTETYIPKGVGIPFHNNQELLEQLSRQDFSTTEGDEFWSKEGVVPNFRQFWKQQIQS